MSDNRGSWKTSLFLLAIAAGVGSYLYEHRAELLQKIQPANVAAGMRGVAEAVNGDIQRIQQAQARQAQERRRERASTKPPAVGGLYTCAAAIAAGDPPGQIRVHGDSRGVQHTTASGRTCWEPD